MIFFFNILLKKILRWVLFPNHRLEETWILMAGYLVIVNWQLLCGKTQSYCMDAHEFVEVLITLLRGLIN